MSTTIDKGNVVEFPRAVGVPKGELHAFVGNAVLDYMRSQGETLINGKFGAWLYSDGVWELRTDIDAWLGMRIEKVCEGLGITNTNKLTGEVRNRILRSPELWRDGSIPWDQHGKIPTRSGLIDPKTGELEPARLLAPHRADGNPRQHRPYRSCLASARRHRRGRSRGV